MQAQWFRSNILIHSHLAVGSREYKSVAFLAQGPNGVVAQALRGSERPSLGPAPQVALNSLSTFPSLLPFIVHLHLLVLVCQSVSMGFKRDTQRPVRGRRQLAELVVV